MLDEGSVELIASHFIPHKCVQKELSASNDVLAWYSVSKYQCGVLLINMNHVVCCCLMTRHTEAMATFASLNASVLALKPWKCYKEIVEFGG